MKLKFGNDIDVKFLKIRKLASKKCCQMLYIITVPKSIFNKNAGINYSCLLKKGFDSPINLDIQIIISDNYKIPNSTSPI